MSFTTVVAAKFAALSAGFMALPLAAQIAIGVAAFALLAGTIFGIYRLATANSRKGQKTLDAAQELIDSATPDLFNKDRKAFTNALTAAKKTLEDDLINREGAKADQVEAAKALLKDKVAPGFAKVVKANTEDAAKAAAEAAAKAQAEGVQKFEADNKAYDSLSAWQRYKTGAKKPVMKDYLPENANKADADKAVAAKEEAKKPKAKAS